MAQLFANYGAEKLLAAMRESLYRSEEGMYVTQGIPLPPVAWWSNDPVVKVVDGLHKPMGVMSIVEEACLYGLTDAYVLLQRVASVIPSLSVCVSMCVCTRVYRCAYGLPLHVVVVQQLPPEA